MGIDIAAITKAANALQKTNETTNVIHKDIDVIVEDIKDVKKMIFTLLAMLQAMGKMPPWYNDVYAIAVALFQSAEDQSSTK